MLKVLSKEVNFIINFLDKVTLYYGISSDISNYRCIAKINSIPKFLEKMRIDLLYHHISPLLSLCQHGFRKIRSSTTNVLGLTAIVNKGFSNKMQSDFSKAFDKVKPLLPNWALAPLL